MCHNFCAQNCNRQQNLQTVRVIPTVIQENIMQSVKRQKYRITFKTKHRLKLRKHEKGVRYFEAIEYLRKCLQQETINIQHSAFENTVSNVPQVIFGKHRAMLQQVRNICHKISTKITKTRNKGMVQIKPTISKICSNTHTYLKVHTHTTYRVLVQKPKIYHTRILDSFNYITLNESKLIISPFL